MVVTGAGTILLAYNIISITVKIEIISRSRNPGKVNGYNNS